MLRQYWPNAIKVEGGESTQISTYDAADTMAIAKRQFAIWRDAYQYKLTRCWVDIYENGSKIDTIKEADIP